MNEASKWVLASHNDGKLAELSVLLGRCPVEPVSAASFELDEPPETGDTYEANAILKATLASKATGLVALSDDSGVEAEALDGQRGVYTADWAGPKRDFAIAYNRVRELLEAAGPGTSHRAKWVSVLCLAKPSGEVRTFRGETRGVFAWTGHEVQGFGFEPVFLPDGYAVTYAEMPRGQVLRVNARAHAMRKLIAEVFASQTGLAPTLEV